MAQLITITSEALQATIRRLLPSQQGFGEDLQATNVVTPIIDLTPTAEGSALPFELQSCLSFNSQNDFSVVNTTATLVDSPGFWRFFGEIGHYTQSAASSSTTIELSTGLATKSIVDISTAALGFNTFQIIPFDFYVFLRPGDSVTATSSDTSDFINGSSRQVADSAGNLIQPAGFEPQ